MKDAYTDMDNRVLKEIYNHSNDEELLKVLDIGYAPAVVFIKTLREAGFEIVRKVK